MPLPNTDANGIVSIPSPRSVDDTVARLRGILDAKGIALFALIDHSGEAAKAGLHMPDTKLLIFGNPKGGTPLMLAAPNIAIDLPLKILIWEDADAQSWITYNSPDFLRDRHLLPAPLSAVLAAVPAIAAELVQERKPS